MDVELQTYVPSVEQIMAPVLEDADKAISAIMVPNLIGNLPDWAGIRAALAAAGRPDILLIEDSADTIPAYGDFATGLGAADNPRCVSDVATTSFYASHIITACGSGGMVMFNDEAHVKRAAMFRDWGRLGDNSEKVDDRFTDTVDGIVYDTKFLVRGRSAKRS